MIDSNTNCAFCSLKGLTERILHKNDHMISFLSDPSLKPGHTLIITRRHIESFGELNYDEVIATVNEVQRLTKVMKTFAKGIDVWQKYRPYVPEGFRGHKMNHLHIHIIPSNPGELTYERSLRWDRLSPLSASERNDFRNKLAHSL